jgi:hypothetical protein
VRFASPPSFHQPHLASSKQPNFLVSSSFSSFPRRHICRRSLTLSLLSLPRFFASIYLHLPSHRFLPPCPPSCSTLTSQTHLPTISIMSFRLALATPTRFAARRTFATSALLRADTPNVDPKTAQKTENAADAFKAEGKIGSKFNADGEVGSKAQEVGGESSSQPFPSPTHFNFLLLTCLSAARVSRSLLG